MNRECHRLAIWSYFTDMPCFWKALFFTTLVAFYPGCTSDPPLNESTVKFREETLDGFERLTLKLGPALEHDGQYEAAGEVIKDYLQHQYVNGRYVLGLGVLDPSGDYLVGYRMGDTAPGSIEKSGYEDMSFASFKGVDQVVSSRKIIQMPLYFREQNVLVIGAPLVREGRLLGIMCLSFDTEKFEKEWRISEQEFLRIDFNLK